MPRDLRGSIALLLTIFLLWISTGCGRRTAAPKPPLQAPVFNPLQQALEESYVELFQQAPRLEFTAAQIEQMRQYLQAGQEYCVGQFKARADQYAKQVQQDQETLKKGGDRISAEQRHTLHCNIEANRIHEARTRVLAGQAVPVAYENLQAKLDLIQQWPAQLRQIQQQLASGAYQQRPFANVQDIGFRDIAPGQADDIKLGQEAIRDLKQQGLLPDELKDPAVQNYVRQVGDRIARNSDLRIPLHVTVLNSKEINAFALPGGYLFVDSGLIEAADNESQLAGVMAHEIAHVADRHSHKLIKKATISQLVFQAAQVAALLLTGGAVGPGLYYALQYGFQGLGLVLSLTLLGVSREYELQADQLGIQYAWKAGYDPEGFTNFFDKMATKEGYVTGTSWFRTHPPFYQRMVDAQREMMFLPKKENFTVQTSAFLRMKQELAVALKQSPPKDEKKAPSLLGKEPGCTPPKEIGTEPGQSIQTVCSLPTRLEQGEATPQP